MYAIPSAFHYVNRTRAKLSEDGRHWLLSGEKTSINNGAIADLMIVFAKVEVTDVDDKIKDTVSCFVCNLCAYIIAGVGSSLVKR